MQNRFVSLLIILLFTHSISVHATEEQERETLMQLLNELVFLTTMIDRAESQRESTARYQFNYPELRRDLELVQQGITEHLSRAKREPRTLPKLSGDYR